MAEAMDHNQDNLYPDMNETKKYSDVVTSNQPKNSTKPVFVKESDLFGVNTPSREQWLNHVELYKAISRSIPGETIVGIQRVRGLWRVYTDCDRSRDTLLTSGIHLRGKSVPLYNSNPLRPSPHSQRGDAVITVRVKNIPLSADDGQIRRIFTIRDIEIVSFYREKLRVDGRLTNCETGDRIAVVNKFSQPFERSVEVGRYRAIVLHNGQINRNLKCNNCFGEGHIGKNCPNDIKCRECGRSGHKAADCAGENDSVEDASDEDDSNNEESGDEEEETGTEEVYEEAETGTAVGVYTDRDTTQTKCQDNTRQSEAKISETPPPQTSEKEQNKKEKKSDKKKDKITKHQRSTLDKFVTVSSTPSRKSNNIAKDFRSPPTPAEELESGSKPKKKQRDESS